jgi:hypothetical protein
MDDQPTSISESSKDTRRKATKALGNRTIGINRKIMGSSKVGKINPNLRRQRPGPPFNRRL